jgi:phage terminase large subunit GpA-like protein
LNDEATWKRDNYRTRPKGMGEIEAKESGRAYWQATVTGEPGVASWCDFSALNAPVGWRPWPELVQGWLQAQQALQAGDEGPLITFTNNMLGRCYRHDVKASIGADALQKRAEAYDLMTAPMGVLVVTAGVDTQDNRLAVVIRGWGRGEESWGLWHGEIQGDPALPDVWRKLAQLLESQIRHVSGQMMRIDAVAVDSGGHHTEDVYAFTRGAQLRGKHWFAIKGAKEIDAPKLGRPKTQEFTWRGQAVPGGATLRNVGTQAIKTLIDGRLKLAGHGGGGYYHFPIGFDAEYYKQLRAENRVWERDRRNTKRLVWKGTQRNEAWDCEVYNYAAFLYAMSGRHAETVFRERERLFGSARQLDLLDAPAAEHTDSLATEPADETPASADAQTSQQDIAAEDERIRAPMAMVKRRAQRLPRRGGFVPGWR